MFAPSIFSLHTWLLLCLFWIAAAFPSPWAVLCFALTQTLGGLPAEVHGVQAHGTFGGPHIEPHVEAMGDVVVHSLLQAPAVLCKGHNPSAGSKLNQ